MMSPSAFYYLKQIDSQLPWVCTVTMSEKVSDISFWQYLFTKLCLILVFAQSA